MDIVRVVIGASDATRLRSLADRAGLRVVGEAAGQERALELALERDAEAILLEGTPEVSCDARVPTVVFGDDADLAAAAGAGAHGVVPADADEAFLTAVLDVATSRAHDLVAVRGEIESLKEELETRKLVERAKGILMERLKLTECEAYRRIQKASQDENRKMRDIADSIVRTEKIMSEQVRDWPGAESRRHNGRDSASRTG